MLLKNSVPNGTTANLGREVSSVIVTCIHGIVSGQKGTTANWSRQNLHMGHTDEVCGHPTSWHAWNSSLADKLQTNGTLWPSSLLKADLIIGLCKLSPLHNDVHCIPPLEGMRLLDAACAFPHNDVLASAPERDLHTQRSVMHGQPRLPLVPVVARDCTARLIHSLVCSSVHGLGVQEAR